MFYTPVEVTSSYVSLVVMYLLRYAMTFAVGAKLPTEKQAKRLLGSIVYITIERWLELYCICTVLKYTQARAEA